MSPYPFVALLEINPDLEVALLPLIDGAIGGVLLMGAHGTAKSTIARSVSALMSSGIFVDVPISVSEERLLGGVDVSQLLEAQSFKRKVGLLEKAHQGVLYIDEINLAPPAVLAQLQDVSVLGWYHLERDGLSAKIDAQFVLFASMNHEAGMLSDAMMDRFGLSIAVPSIVEAKKRSKVLGWQLNFASDPNDFLSRFENAQLKVKKRIIEAQEKLESVIISTQILDYVAQKMLACKQVGLRADLSLVRAARALAALRGTICVEKAQVDFLLPFVLGHRAVSQQLEQPAQHNAAHSNAGKDSLPSTWPSSATNHQPNTHTKNKEKTNNDGAGSLLQCLSGGQTGQTATQKVRSNHIVKKKALK